MSFDRAATIYDATRAIPADVLDRIVAQIEATTQAGPDTRFLEIGVGTGRIALPLVRRGHNLTGVDISDAMMDVLRARLVAEDRVTLINANLLDLPFPQGTFDVGLFVHVLHLVPEWQQALRETLRVLKPTGRLVLGDDHGAPGSPVRRIREQWRAVMQEIGVSPKPHHGTWDRLHAELTDLGGWIATYLVARWESELVPLEQLELLRRRTHSEAWDLPQEALDRAHALLLLWAAEQFGDVESAIPNAWEFELSVTAFEPETYASFHGAEG